jgi:hypothetical protein
MNFKEFIFPISSCVKFSSLTLHQVSSWKSSKISVASNAGRRRVQISIKQQKAAGCAHQDAGAQQGPLTRKCQDL